MPKKDTLEILLEKLEAKGVLTHWDVLEINGEIEAVAPAAATEEPAKAKGKGK